jgi:hypothetical protein
MPVNQQIRLEALRSAPLDAWVALCEDESAIVAVAKTYSEVVALSHEHGVRDPVILKTPSEWAPLSV